jgi:hypothetical protein
MKKENVLKKEFNKRDVERMRNLVKGNAGDRTTQSIGYSKKQEFHKEGDVWEENDRTWTIENGLKQNVTKLDKAKKAHLFPMFCSSCKSKMTPHIDKQYYKIHKKCLNCVIDMEHQIRTDGKWDEYEKEMKNKEIDSIIEDYKKWIKDFLGGNTQSYIAENGDIETWKENNNKEELVKRLEDGITFLKSMKVS